MATTSTVFLKDTELSISEVAGTVTEHILRSGSLSNPVTITYGLTGDTATEGQDFQSGITTVTMPAGVSDLAIPVRIFDDSLPESTELAVFSLVNVQGGTLWAPRTSRISILDDETPAPPANPEPPLTSDYNVSATPVLSGLDQPIKMLFSPVNPSTAYVAEKGGVIAAADMNTGMTKVMLDIQDQVNSYGDRGLLDIALHPDFARNPYVYAYVVVDPAGTAAQTGNAGPDGGGNRYAQVVRYTADASTGFTTIVPGSKVVVLGAAGQSLSDISGGGQQDFTDPGFSGATASDRYVDTTKPAPTLINGFKQDYIKVDSSSHAGGALVFGPDGALYVSTGDGTSFDYADPRTVDVQSLGSLSGKVLRIDPLTGQGLPDSPFVGSTTALDSNQAKVYQLGLRNPFSMAFDGEGRLFLSNTGWNSWEAINMAGPGANFGWPYFEGGDGGTLLWAPSYRDFASAGPFYSAVANGSTAVTPAFRAFSHNSFDPGYQVQAITGGEVAYSGNKYPSEFANDYFFSDFAGGRVYTVDVNDRSSLKFLYQGGSGAVPVDYVQGPDGYVYYVNIATGEIGRLEITARSSSVQPATTAVATTVGTGSDTLVLRISQDAYLGNAQYTVSVDGVQVGGTLTAAALHGSGQSDTVTVLGDWAPGTHTAAITFINDAYGGGAAGDRNLYLDGASYDGITLSDASRELFSNGSAPISLTDSTAVALQPGNSPPPPGSSMTVGAGSDTLVLRISQDAYLGNAQYTVSIDGVQVGGTLTAAALHGSGQSDAVTVLGDWAPGTHTAAVTFINDAYGGGAAADRNLYLDGASYDGITLSDASRGLFSNGSASISLMDSTAVAPPPGNSSPPASSSMTVGAGSDTLALRIAQDAYNGNAQFTISVDSAQVGGTLTAAALHGSGQADTINVLGSWAPGVHSATINFLNDAYGGTAAADRNLYLDGATYDGATVSGATLLMYSSGAQSFTFLDGNAPTPANTKIGAGLDSLVLHLSEDAYNGDAQYTVSIDDMQVGGTITAAALHASGQSDTVTVLGSWAAGTHKATISFLNDAYAGTAATDRNLYLDGASFKDMPLPNTSAVLLSNGAVDFSFVK